MNPQIQAAYDEYCEAKADIGEEPFDFQTWLDIEIGYWPK